MADKNFRDNLNGIVKENTTNIGNRLSSPRQTAAIPGNVGIATHSPTQPASAGGGAFGNITEKSRTYYADQTITSSDGIFSFARKPVRTITFQNADGNTMTMTLNSI